MSATQGTPLSWDEALTCLRVDVDRDGEASNKPLLILMILAAAIERRSNWFPFNEVETLMGEALKRFGRKTPSAARGTHLAFWHLESDGCWTVINRESIPLGRNEKRPTVGSLRAQNATGMVPKALWTALVDDPSMARKLFSQVASRFFEPAAHAEIERFYGIANENTLS